MGLVGTIDTSPTYKNLLLGLKSSTWSKKCLRKAVADSVEVRGELLEGQEGM